MRYIIDFRLEDYVKLLIQEYNLSKPLQLWTDSKINIQLIKKNGLNGLLIMDLLLSKN